MPVDTPKREIQQLMKVLSNILAVKSFMWYAYRYREFLFKHFQK